MHAKTYSATTVGVDAHLVQVEVDIAGGLPKFFIVGLPDAALKESTKRILTSLKNSGFRLTTKVVTVNLSPADLKKEGTLFDLPIAIAILMAGNFLDVSKEFIDETLFLGELSLDGGIGFVKGVLAIASNAKKLNKKRIIVPKANAQEAALINDLEVIGVQHLTDLIAYIRGEQVIEITKNVCITSLQKKQSAEHDFCQVKGQQQAKRALQISAAGRHNILFIGAPGSGKTMLAKRLPSIMPPMLFEEVLETSKIYSISGKLGKQSLVLQRPFRAPHHTISQAGLVGGGSYPQPGEISLAHHGILFLDELTEFKRETLEVLRQPLESKNVCISRVHQSISFPASIILIAALNPCPCGFFGDKKRICQCSSHQISKYLGKLSGPLLDRIDLQISIQSLEYDTIKSADANNMSSQELFIGVSNAVIKQQQRFGTQTLFNSAMPSEMIDKYCILTEAAQEIMKKAFERLNLSMRGYHKILKVARTIADIENQDLIDTHHIQEAIMYRSLDKHLEQQRT